MSNILRRFKREQLKHQLGTNKINNEWHKRYEYKPNITKFHLKILDRLKQRIRKSLWKDLRNKKKVKNDNIQS